MTIHVNPTYFRRLDCGQHRVAVTVDTSRRDSCADLPLRKGNEYTDSFRSIQITVHQNKLIFTGAPRAR